MVAGLTDKRRIFLEAYLSCWNATEAARRAGYAQPGSEGHRLLKNAEIQVAIAERVSDVAMGADEVLVRLAEQARGAPENFIEIKAGLPFMNWDSLKETGGLRLIKKLKYDGNGNPEVEFYDAQAALIQLGRVHGLFTDKQQIAGPDGGALIINLMADDGHDSPA